MPLLVKSTVLRKGWGGNLWSARGGLVPLRASSAQLDKLKHVPRKRPNLGTLAGSAESRPSKQECLRPSVDLRLTLRPRLPTAMDPEPLIGVLANGAFDLALDRLGVARGIAGDLDGRTKA
jgi:hypothetical protein